MKPFPWLLTPILALLALAPSRAATLDRVLSETLKNNPRILQAKAAVEGAAGQRIILRSLGYPQVLVGSVAGDQGGRRSQSSSNQPFILGYGIFSQPLFQAGIPASIRRGDLTILIAQQQLNLAVTEELEKARLAFYRALYNRELQSLGEAQRERLDKNVAGEQSRYEAGQAERGALTSATLLARELDPEIAAAQNAYGAALLELAQSMGNGLGPKATLPSPEGKLEFRPVNLHWNDEVSRALRDRVDLKLARLVVRAAREDQRIIAAKYYPEVKAVGAGVAIPVTGIYHDTGGSPQATDSTVANEIGIGASYSWRVIDNGAVGGAVRQQRAAREANEIELQKLEASVPRELAHLQNQLQAIAARYHSLVAAADVADKNVQSIEENRAQGLASVLDFRRAENDLLITRRGILVAIYQEQLALAEWDRATGRYFQFSDEMPTSTE
jgi:outer membrane protein TolC